MATVTGRINCVICRKERATAKCAGCLQDFCVNDFTEHHKLLNKQLDDIEVHRDLFRQTLLQQITEPTTHPLMAQIDRWEQNSITKIRESAEETRLLLITRINDFSIQLEEKLTKLTDQLRQSREEDDIIETDLERWKNELEQMAEEYNKPAHITIQLSSIPLINQLEIQIAAPLAIPIINIDARWVQNGVTVAGGNGQNSALNQLNDPWSVLVDNDQTVYIADRSNHRIVQWKNEATSGEIIAGGNGQGGRIDQLNRPVNVIIDKESDTLIICDYGNKRVVRWPRQNGETGETIISNISCWGLAMDNVGSIYVSDVNKNEVKRYKRGETEGTIVAGGNGKGKHVDQLNGPYYIFVDQDHSVYVSDCNNHRIMKWKEGARKGILVAGDTDYGKGLNELSGPYGIIVDQLGTMYIADCNNNRVMRWPKGAAEGSVIVGANGSGKRANQFDSPCALTFDQQNNLYIVDNNNHRVQKFNLDQN